MAQAEETTRRDALTAAFINLSVRYDRYGYKRITSLLNANGSPVNHKRVARLSRREGLKVPTKQLKRDRLWLNDGSRIQLPPQYRNHVWAYELVQDRTRDSRKFHMLAVIDELSREYLAIKVERRLRSQDVFKVFGELMVKRGAPDYFRSDNGSELQSTAVREWLATIGARALYVEPGSPYGNGFTESFNGRLRDDRPKTELFNHLAEAKKIIETWRHHYKTIRPHTSLGYRSPAPETVQAAGPPSAVWKLQPDRHSVRIDLMVA